MRPPATPVSHIPARWRRVLLAVAIAGAALGVAACGSSGNGSTTTTIPGY